MIADSRRLQTSKKSKKNLPITGENKEKREREKKKKESGWDQHS